METSNEPTQIELLSLQILPDWTLSIQMSMWIIAVLLLSVLAYSAWRWRPRARSWGNLEIDRAEIGLGVGKLRLRPNLTDRQVAYAIWVELSTRKIGLPIDFDHDVIAEIYDSWYDFFAITRELLKSVPVSKVRCTSTQEIIDLSIEVLNRGLRPHLTLWQARFRSWYEKELRNTGDDSETDPQEIQKGFPKYIDLSTDLERINKILIKYRDQMRRLALLSN